MVSNVGINLRLDYIDEILVELPKLSVLEVIVDNWLSLGPHHKKLERLREHYDILFHCVGMNLGGTDKLNYDYLNKVKELKDRYDPVHVSDHLCFGAHSGNHHHDLLPFPFNESYLENSTNRINEIQDFFGEKILVENLSYYVEYKESEMSEAQFISKLAYKTDCNLLVDLNNIWVNSKNINVNVNEHLAQMDWSKVKEIHVAGAELFGNIYVDTHGSNVNEEVLEIARSCKDKIQDIPIIYEKDNNVDSLKDMLEQVEVLNGVIYDKD